MCGSEDCNRPFVDKVDVTCASEDCNRPFANFWSRSISFSDAEVVDFAVAMADAVESVDIDGVDIDTVDIDIVDVVESVDTLDAEHEGFWVTSIFQSTE
jgi:hypothetical protein